MKYDSLIPKTHFISLWGFSKMHFSCPCSMSWSSLCLWDTAIRPFFDRAAAVQRNWGWKLLFHVKIHFIIHIIIIQDQTHTKKKSQKADRKGGGVTVSPLSPDREEMWKFWPIFPLKFDSLIPKTHFTSLWGVSKCIFHALVACLEALSASGIPPSDHFLTEQQQYRGIGDSSSWMKMTFFMSKSVS